MESRYDLLQNSNSIVIQNNDLVIAESDDQHIEDTINANVGYWKENPLDGVNIRSYLKGVNVEQTLERSVKLNLQSDGYNARPKVGYNSKGELVVNPNVTQ